MALVHYRFATIDGQRLFYREAGDPQAPTLVLLHGFPTSSYMFRHLIPLLADRFHVIAPDHLGFGQSAAPSVDDFDYTFDALADLTEHLLDALDVQKYSIYVQDYGAPIGWRLFIRNSDSISAIVTQNGNGYDAGFVESFWKTVWAYQAEQNEETEAGIRFALSLEATKWQYLTGVPDATLVDPEAWEHDYALLSRPGNDLIQLKLFLDYATNQAIYPKLHEVFRQTQVPLLAVWGSGDEIFSPAGATAFTEDLPEADVHLIDGGHFLLESAVDEVASLMVDFLATRTNAAPRDATPGDATSGDATPGIEA